MMMQVVGSRILYGTAEITLVSPPFDSLIFVCSRVKDAGDFSNLDHPLEMVV